MLLRHQLDKGLMMTEISRELDISSQTVYRWVKSGELHRQVEEVRCGPRPPVLTKLDPYEGIIRDRLEEFPDLTVVRLLDEIRAAGYPGGYTRLKEYVRKVRPRPPDEPVSSSKGRLASRPRTTSPTSAAPGAGALPRWWCWATVGSCGSASTGARTMRTLIGGLESAFGFFGTVPSVGVERRSLSVYAGIAGAAR